ncbi:MAG: L,D-transpeptidase/peptidoglycan binding protein, partial [Lachnospiraceae bacterium]|nr:L,D-transpeptidase/peptidoglycan binding protein [Lachnospiraceae bacterium]
EIIDGALLSEWLSVEGAKVILDKTKVEAYVAELRKKYDTIFRNRTFMTSYGKEVTIVGGDYGWWMDYEQEAVELAEMIENGESGERTPVYFQTAASYETPDYGNTYVEINLTAQHLFLYKDGEKILESDFVSGNASRGYDTPAGAYSITYKQRDATLTGENYRTPVSYWMPFNRNIGMHDANWRGSFGGNIYKTNGSHGCINLPPSKAKTIYETIEKGTAVICYHLPGTEPVVKIQDKGEPTEQPAEGTPSPEQPVEATAPETPATPPPEAPVE